MFTPFITPYIFVSWKKDSKCSAHHSISKFYNIDIHIWRHMSEVISYCTIKTLFSPIIWWLGHSQFHQCRDHASWKAHASETLIRIRLVPPHALEVVSPTYHYWKKCIWNEVNSQQWRLYSSVITYAIATLSPNQLFAKTISIDSRLTISATVSCPLLKLAM